ncbi:MAG: hypothetical protein JWO35_376 [Candidatus Saccharibacteria bacterium]|nr:hypothetical protein [Candidatus Saccharibacteria bacterium]
MQAIKIKVMKSYITSFILVAKRKARATHDIATAHAFGQPAHKGRLAAAQVTNKLNDLTTFKPSPDLLGER